MANDSEPLPLPIDETGILTLTLTKNCFLSETIVINQSVFIKIRRGAFIPLLFFLLWCRRSGT